MTPDESILDAVNRLEVAVRKLEAMVRGDVDLNTPGLAVEVRQLRAELDAMRATKPSIWQWILGFWLFVGGVVLSNHAACNLFGVSPALELSFSILLWLISMVFFLGGLGLLRWR